MARTWVDGGFEIGAPGLVLGGAAEISTERVRSGKYALKLHAERGGILGTITSNAVYTLDLNPGEEFPLRFFAEGTDGAAADMRVDVDFLDGFGFTPWYFLPWQRGWQKVTVDPVIVATGPQIAIRLLTRIPAGMGSGTWYIDDINGNLYYPPENGRGPRTGEVWHVDDIMGLVVPAARIWRDDGSRALVDGWDADEPGKDEWRYRHPGERYQREP